ncbi:rho GTPase-activating protein 11A isoform X2 [Spea bombifrons]|uniref:rho GTPase-activating protein 11A isoform X2 n=1 Tax=Spea bombifrons TaxID=233779 RepID=UPI00234A49EA|nr:rho GTPase-activating protein 11A isoform X2 [Spea bombifrons]
MKQTPGYHNLARLAVIQHLRTYGIKIKHWNSKQRPEAGKGSTGDPVTGKVFGMPLHTLPQLYVEDYGNVPVFLVDVCRYLKQHVHTEGLFRKSGSVVRQKQLKTKLDQGDSSLSGVPPCDVAGILKQFFRELPEPVLQTDLQDALCKAQQLPNDEEKTSATILISCLMPDRTIHVLRYFFSFLHAVSLRSDANKMDSSNLAVIFAPNLLQSNDDNEKISANTEKKLRLQAGVVQTLINQAADIGCVPTFLLERIPGMLGVDGCAGTPGPDASQEGEVDSLGEKKRRRRSVGGLASMVTPLVLTPSSKRKLPADSVQGFSNKKRKSIKHNLAFELLPNSLFGSSSTPGSARCDDSTPTSESLQSVPSPSVPSSSALRRSKRSENRKVQRVESGKTGCFSPKITRKEMVRRSLRLRFSLGKSSKDVSALSGLPSNSLSQNIGWRLANSQELTPGPLNKENVSSPMESPFVSAGSKKISKSEENLLSPKISDGSNHRMSWTGPRPVSFEDVCDEATSEVGQLFSSNCLSEPVLGSGKPPAMPKDQKSSIRSYLKDQNPNNDSLCEEEASLAENTVLRITKAFTESGSDLRKVLANGTYSDFSVKNSEVDNVLMTSQDETNVFLEHKPIEVHSKDETVCFVDKHSENSLALEQSDASKKVEDTDLMHSQKLGCNEIVQPAVSEVSSESSLSTAAQEGGLAEMQQELFPCQNRSSSESSDTEETSGYSTKDCHAASSALRRSSRVSDHIQHFNKLCLSDRSSMQKLKSPIKFQRTPVRQSVRRINSLSEMRELSTKAKQVANNLPMMKSVSCDGSVSSERSLRRPSCAPLPVASRQVLFPRDHLTAAASPTEASSRVSRQSLKNSPCRAKSVLEDLTNQDRSNKSIKRCDPSNNSTLRAVSGRERLRYKGSPRNPITRVTFLPSTKPLEL